MRPWPLVLLALALAGPSAAEEEATAAKPTITKPEWLRIPSGRTMTAGIPKLAKSRAIQGAATLFCSVNGQGRLENCTIATEDPPGFGFGSAALGMASEFQMKPTTADGKKVEGGTIKQPFVFFTDRPPVPYLSAVAWAATPTAAQIAAAFPTESGADHATLRFDCEVQGSGALSDCLTLLADPQSPQFQKSVDPLSRLFRVDLGAGEKRLPAGARVSLSIDIPNPAKPQPPLRVTAPVWLSFPAPQVVQAAFPAKAREARVASGRVMLDCKADHEGRLVDCSAGEPDSAGLGFAEAALKVVDNMRINPWVAPGRPTDGAIIRFALRMEDAPAPTAETRTN